jgi:hypothetical protein
MRLSVAALAAAAVVTGYLPPLPTTRVRTRRRATVQDEPQQTRKEFTVPKAASTRETEVRAVTALSRDGNVSLPEVFVGNDGSSRQLYDNGVVMPVGWTGASTRRRTGSKFTGTLLASTEFPVGDAGANPQRIKPFSRKTWLQGVRDDIRKRSPLYAQDWFDGLRNPAKSAGACLFLYFAVLAPAVAFGGVMQTATCGALGPRDVLLSCGLSGMAYACLAGQPMTFVAPTGLTLSFIGALSAWTIKSGVPFLPMYAWCGCWTALYLAVLASFNASGLIRYCTRFTEDVFNALLAFNFVSEGFSPVRKVIGTSLASSKGAADALLAANAAGGTCLACRAFAGAPKTRFFTARARSLLADFGPAATIVFASSLFSLPSVRKLGSLKRLTLGAPREKLFSLVDMGALSLKYRLLAAIPAVFLATLFFLDQNITVRTVNSPQNKLKKGAAYHLDLFALASITLASSLLGLPWMCSATVQSLNHVRALSTYADQETQTVEKVDTPTETKPSKPAPLAAPAAQKRPLPSPDEIIRAAKTEPPAKKPLPKAGDIILARSLVSVQKRTTTQPQKGISFGGYANDYLEVVNKTLQVNRTQEDRAEAVAAASRATAGGGAARVAQAKELALKPVNVVTKPTVSGDVKDVVETRLTGFTVHALVLASLGFAPVLAEVPLAVVWGVFLFLGFKVMAGNQFLGRVGSLFVDTGMLNPTSETERAVVELGRKRVLRYTAVQASCLAALWLLKLNKATAMVFPSVIGVLLVLRASLLPRVFSPRELLTLDTEIDR